MFGLLIDGIYRFGYDITLTILIKDFDSHRHQKKKQKKTKSSKYYTLKYFNQIVLENLFKEIQAITTRMR